MPVPGRLSPAEFYRPGMATIRSRHNLQDPPALYPFVEIVLTDGPGYGIASLHRLLPYRGMPTYLRPLADCPPAVMRLDQVYVNPEQGDRLIDRREDTIVEDCFDEIDGEWPSWGE